MAEEKNSYNERLFEAGGIRSYLHNARFWWFKKQVSKRLPTNFSMIELGCYDGRLIDFCPNPPQVYYGFDAGWEGGLALAQEKFGNHPTWKFIKALKPSDMDGTPDNGFDIAASLETLEHIPPELIDGYLEALAMATDGILLVTVPNEKGPVFLAKYLIKRFVMRQSEPYTPGEILHATMGRLDKISRNEHKGFDYAGLIERIENHFDVETVENLPFPFLPVWMAFTVGIIARSKPKSTVQVVDG